jgi:uncharacterized coiled-coil protein SlyX
LQLGRAVRERFLVDAGNAMTEIGSAVMIRLTELVDEPGGARESQTRRDTWMAYKSLRETWVSSTIKQWRDCLEPAKPKSTDKASELANMELVGNEAVENKILASRLVLAVNEKVLADLDDLRVRIKWLEGIEDLDGRDVLRPEVLVLLLVEQWSQSGMPGDTWPMVNAVVQRILIERLRDCYKNANKALVGKGVLPTIELKDRVKAPVRTLPGYRPAPVRPMPPTAEQPEAAYGDPSYGYASRTVPGAMYADSDFGNAPYFEPTRPGTFVLPAAPVAPSAPGPLRAAAQYASAPGGAATFWRQGANAQSPGMAYAAADEARMGSSPFARAQQRAQGVIGQLRRIFVGSAGADYAATMLHQPSPALIQALSPQGVAATQLIDGTLYEDYSPVGVARLAQNLREKTLDLKKKTESKGEKATIEIVALMFQAILSEERIPPGIRVWFSRLQMPVLRVALEDPDFLGTTDHPARLLIDRMGSCVMGFDATGVQIAAMEAEVRRVVQVIEQYPDTGSKVYRIVYEEFQKFLAKFLSDHGGVQKVVGVAQQVEQKETLAIQYTIEVRNMLKDMPVREEVRVFLFKVWAEVLAVSALRKGAKHADTQILKKSVTDLVWAASAKPNRTERAKVIQDLPQLLAQLRAGMELLAMPVPEQDAHIKKISDTLADAFQSKTQAIAQDQIDAMAKRLTNLEDLVGEDGVGDLPLDAESLEMMLGIDAATMEVVVNGGAKPSAAMLAWAGELQLGAWFTLDHNSHLAQVQFVWRSERKHLNLFASSTGKGYLLQAGRLAAYLQAGLLLPQEDEALTVRAARNALAKLEANPERLLG